MNDSNLTVTWIDGHREPQCAPDPDFPEGIDVDVSDKMPVTCFAALPYPAKRCGYFRVVCGTCGLTVAVTTAGRPDDPRSIRVACWPKPN